MTGFGSWGSTEVSSTRPIGALERIPGYLEGLADLAPKQQGYELNCDTVHTIAAGQVVSYAMELAIPSSVHPGTTRVCWTLAAFNADPNPADCGTLKIT